LLLKAHVEYLGLEDIKAAYSATSQFTPVELQLEDEAGISVVVALGNREPEAAIRILEAFPHDFIGGGGYGSFPVRSWIGDAREMEAQPDVIGRRERLSPIRSSGSKLEQILKWFSGAPRRFRARLRLSADLQALGNPG